MDVIEFLQNTDQKNIKNYIRLKVKEKVHEYKLALQGRQLLLRNIFEFENTQFNEEIVQLFNAQLKDQFVKRLDWVNTCRMKRVKAEEELLKLKNQQRELENCEKWLHFQNKQLLLDSKKGQLYQIENKKMRCQKEKEIDKMWQEAMERLEREKEYQEIYETKLLKVIEEANQLKNQEIRDKNKQQQELEYQQSKHEFQEEDLKALFMEEKYRKAEERRELLKKTRYKQMLKSQIDSNLQKKTWESQLFLKEAHLQKEIDDLKFLEEREQTQREKIRNKEWNICYLKDTRKDIQKKLKEENEFERAYINTGCVLQQETKKPYRKNTR